MALDIKSLLSGAKSNILFLKDKVVGKRQPGVVVNHVTVRPVVRQSQDIQKWRSALIVAEQENQQRQLLYDLYDEIMLDGRLDALIEQRVTRITNTRLSFTTDGKTVDVVENLQNKMFFRRFLREVLMARFYGHSLMELQWPGFSESQTDTTGTTNLIPRKHVKPRKGIVTKNAYDIEGLPYREDPYKRFCIEVGESNELGLILKVCPYIIYKRGGFGDWAEFAEVFGMPFRWATYQNEQSRAILEDALKNAGSAGYVVAPQDANLQFFNPTAGSQSNDIFRFLIDSCNQEVAITILGNTMTTTEAKHSGYAQSETQWKTQDEIHQDDRAFVLCILNEKLVPYLAAQGYPVTDGQFTFVDGDGLSLTARLEIDTKVSEFVPIGEDYWYEKYGIPKPLPGELPEEDPAPTGKKDPVKKEKVKGGTAEKKA